ncbi:hypothetical protein H9L12_00235 [Sphingomonas rhizophila]|uniref:Exo-alpha-sialidase n=2 Tax=Sphingomonas rhizophila TaxID=2071607 RepID=A0A7G9SE31_9SPHN|nr:hypothetical protein H9L12_00235 [Sphingomonas rhizophila]
MMLAAPVLVAATAPVPYRWTNVTIGGGGYAPNILMSSAEPSLAYLRTDMGGAYRWDSAASRWIPLQDDNAESSFMGVEAIAPDPVDPDIVTMAAGMGYGQPSAILRSADRGARWSVVPVPFAMGGNEAGRGLGERLSADPNRPSTLLFGSRHDGLWRSDDRGATWRKVDGFPRPGLGKPERRQTHGGVSFVLADPSSGRSGGVSRRWWAGSADESGDHLFLSEDGAVTWRAVSGPEGLLAVKGAIAGDGTLFVGYASGIGPSGVKTGAVWRFGADGRGTAITPADHGNGGFFEVATARTSPATVAVSTINRSSGDTVWLSNDSGRSWRDLGKDARRDVSATPFLGHDGKDADFGHWITGLAIDPFDARHIAYTTGATVYATKDLANWAPWTRGIEQTAVITLVSPTDGPPLVSGFGDLAGFVHDDLERSPRPRFTNPYLSNTNRLDYAGLAPRRWVRGGSLFDGWPREASLAISSDGGRSWSPIKLPPIPQADGSTRREDLNGETPPAVSADGKLIVVSASRPMVSDDDGRRWSPVEGVSRGSEIVADKRIANRFYALDFATDRLLRSNDGGRRFRSIDGASLPGPLDGARPTRGRESQPRLVASPFAGGELFLHWWQGLFRSSDGGKSLVPVSGDLKVELFGLGKGTVHPTLYAVGKLGDVRGIWRSDDLGRNWARINDDAHQWGLRFRAISGDPRRAGRVYVATDGRGIFYGDPTGGVQ